MPFDCSESYCNRHHHHDFADIHPRPYSDCCGTQRLGCCYWAGVDTAVHFVRSVEHNCRIGRSTWADCSGVAVQ